MRISDDLSKFLQTKYVAIKGRGGQYHWVNVSDKTSLRERRKETKINRSVLVTTAAGDNLE